jgi:hypothetical protein
MYKSRISPFSPFHKNHNFSISKEKTNHANYKNSEDDVANLFNPLDE